MAFSTKKRAGKYIETDFNGKEFDPISSEVLRTHIEALQAGNFSAIQPILINHIKLAIRIAGQYSYRPSSDQDMVSAALEAIFDGCRNVLQGKQIQDGNITGYLISLIHSRCNRLACENRVIKIPVSSLVRAAKQGVRIKAPILRDIGSVIKRTCFKDNTADLREEILLCCNDEREKLIVKLREQCYTNIEIAEIIGQTPSRIGQLLREIEHRYDKRK